jgi:hypothetical protein
MRAQNKDPGTHEISKLRNRAKENGTQRSKSPKRPEPRKRKSPQQDSKKRALEMERSHGLAGSERRHA